VIAIIWQYELTCIKASEFFNCYNAFTTQLRYFDDHVWLPSYCQNIGDSLEG